MRKLAYGAGLVVLLAGSFSLGAMTAPPSLQMKRVSTDGRAAATAMAAISPFEMMVRSGNTLPAEKWSDPF